MQAELNSDVALSAANALLAHLRRNPEAATKPAHDLALQFGLEESFVVQVLQNVAVPRRPDVKAAPRERGAFQGLAEGIRGIWMRATARPALFVGISLALCYAFVTAIVIFEPRGSRAPTTASLVTGVSVLAVIAGTFLLHMGAYFRHRSARHPLYGGLMLWLSLLALAAIGLMTGRTTSRPPAEPALLFVLAAFGLMMFSLIYTGFGALASVLGGWTRLKLLERAEDSMSRQDLLERYFELQSRLQKSVYPRRADQGLALFASPTVLFYRRYQFLANLAIGFGLSAFEILATESSGLTPGQTQMTLSIWFFAMIFASVVKFLFYIFQGYLSRSAWRAALGAASVAAGSVAAQFLPVSETVRITVGRIGTAGYFLSETLDFAVMIGVSCAAFLGAVVQNRATREANLQRNDQATLLGEMVRIQWKLSTETSAICVMVVDAAKSSEMKSDADPLAVEYTFREYQEWIESISAERGGRVHSTAGDGAVVAFATAGLALSAARRLQTDVFAFNKDVNRLSRPFRLRIGLHTGEVAGDIDQVQFTEVIDIAAHIEAACPVGGITASDDVTQQLPEEEFIDLGVQTDGHAVFLLKEATEYR